MISRRQFIQNTTALTAGVIVHPFSSLSFQANKPLLSFDLHSHPGQFFLQEMKGYPGDRAVAKTITEMNTARITGAFFSLVADAPLIERTPTGIRPTRAYQPGEGLNEYSRQISILKRLLQKLPVRIATHSADLKIESNTVAAFISCEGGDFLEGKTELLDRMYEDGVRSLQIVHYAPNPLGDLQTEPAQHNGLSNAGKEVVKKLNQLGMVIDVAHASYKTVQDVVSITDSPIILSHSILKMENDRPIARRAITPGHAKAIASVGGVIGAWPSGFNKSFDEYVDNLKRLVDTIGIDHVGIGTDMDGNFKPVLDSYLQFSSLEEALRNKGLNASEVKKIMGENVKRVLDKVLKK